LELEGDDLERLRSWEGRYLIRETWAEDYPALALGLNLVPSEACVKL
jgi:hypothetical protein